MKINKGSRRIVFTFPCLGVVVKLPLVHIITACKVAVKAFLLGGWHFFKLQISLDEYETLLTGGLKSNLQEASFFSSEKHPFCQPTYFSLFGLLNVQKYGQICNIKGINIWMQIILITDGERNKKLWECGHHFNNSANFCFDNGKIRMVDYGSKSVCDIISQYGRKIMDEFDASYEWK